MTKNGSGFVVSNQKFGLFSMNDDDGPRIISVYAGMKKAGASAAATPAQIYIRHSPEGRCVFS